MEPRHRGDTVTLSVRMEGGATAQDTLWYRLSAGQLPGAPESMDPFVIGTVFLAMSRGMDLRVHGKVSPSLLRHLEEFQAVWHRWEPARYRPVAIEADVEAEDSRTGNDAAAMMFSGGLDSCFTAWRHVRLGCGRRRQKLKAAVMAHGFDIPLDPPEVFERASENARRLTDSLGLELIPVACNIRQWEGDWEQTHGAALASCLHLLRRRFATGLIAGSHVYEALRFPWGSTPLTDVMFSTDSLSIVYDGGEFTRREKAREVAAWPEAMKRLRVCWEGEHKDRNCGRCLRCVGTAICFAVEQLPVPSSLPVGPLDEAIRMLDGKELKPVSVTRLEELLHDAKAAGIRQSWVAALHDCVHRHRQEKEESTRPGIVRRLRRLLARKHQASAVVPGRGGSL